MNKESKSSAKLTFNINTIRHHNNTSVDIYILHVKLYILTQLPACLILSFIRKILVTININHTKVSNGSLIELMFYQSTKF